MKVVELLAFLALVAFGGVAFWRGLGTKPSRAARTSTIAGAGDDPYVDPHGAQSGSGHGGGT